MDLDPPNNDISWIRACSMIRKYHYLTMQTNLQQCDEEPQNIT